MDFRILGPLEVLEEGRDVAPAGSKGRALLALLLVHANETLPVERLIDELWGEHPPATATKTVQAHVSRLRKALAAGAGDGVDAVIVTREHGYQLTLDPERLDAHRFERLVAEGRRELGTGDPARATAALESALALWRGAPLADVAHEPFVQREVGRLEDLRVAALEDLNEAKLALGRHGELVGELEALIGEHPYRERLRAQLMLALYRCDRQADALQVYQDARRTLVDELGIEPGERLRELERAVLAQDSALAAPVAETGEQVASRLPDLPSRTYGRDGECAAVADLLRRGDIPLVTLTGPGGVGKTRLALEVAREVEPELSNGAWFVSLAAVAKADDVPSAIAQALDVVPLQGETPIQAVERFLAPKRGVLVLDNFEHLLGAAPVVSDLLVGCPKLAVLATSREALGLAREYRFVVSPLRVPEGDGLDDVQRAAAGVLFVERARSRDRGFELTTRNARAIADICRRLDGLPLAIELAAVRTGLLGAEGINGRLASAMDVLGRGPRDAPARQQTLRATIEWSHRLLSAREAEAFARFAVFAGGATIDAAEHVTGADLDVLDGLVEKHLLLRRADRLRMLETVREYARERLNATAETEEVKRRHCRHYLAFVERAEVDLLTGREAEWLPRLDAEVDNLRAALDWSASQGNPTFALRLAGLLAKFWEIRGMSTEGLEWIRAAMEAAGEEAPIHDRARARRARVALLQSQGAVYDAYGLRKHGKAEAVDALDLSRQAEDPAGIAEALVFLGYFEAAESFPQRRRRELAEEALASAQEAQDDRLVANALTERALAQPFSQVTAATAEAEAALRRLGASRTLASFYNSAAYNAIKEGDPEGARPLLERAIPITRELGDPILLILLRGNMGLEALLSGDLDRARVAFADQLRLCREHVIPHLAAEGLSGIAVIAACQGNPERAARLLGAATAITPVGDADVSQQLERRFFAAAREQIGTAHWAAAEEEGGRLSLEEALDEALEPGADTPGEVGGQAVMTFMFTDIVGSTRLLDELGDERWQELLGRHDIIVSDQFVARAGRQIKHEGDGFFVAFPDAGAAVEAGCAIQRALAAHRAQQEGLPKVRIGIHTTTATARGGDYIGRGINQTARIAAAARGDEVLVSRRTLEAAGERFDSCEARDLELPGFQARVEVRNIPWQS
jgi:predicted ATPase/DNA-binding SARP family transcriptional activator/class 3 adenylate cyclase